MTQNEFRTSRRRLLTIAVAATAAFTSGALTACSPPGSDGANAGSSSPTTVSTEIGSVPISLTLYDGAGLKAIDDALIAAFRKKHPNVTITARFDPDNVQSVNAPRVLSSDSPPDIARIGALGETVKSGLLTDLTPWASAYQWEKLPAGQLAQYKSTPDGVRGAGAQYTVASGFTVTGFYYNKELLSRLGLSQAPKTPEEFETALEKAKAANLTGIIAGNQNGQVATSFQFALNRTVGQDKLNSWIFGQPGASIATPDATSAAKTISEWAAKGYINRDTNGTQASDAMGRFARGEALFFASGNWDSAALQKQMGENVGFALPPAADGKAVAMSDPSSNFGIPAKSKNKDAAAAFLNFLTSPEARQIAVDNGFAPSGSGEQPTGNGALSTQVQKAFADLVLADGQVQYIQNASNGANAAWTAQIQLLVDGRTTPEDMLKTVQTQYEQDLGK
ncbi:ABC transporter substrate-binding protein [Arthrobacter sp. MYb23]|uniref:ABC transporter substrate-binding protein n=1 Tax=unclassified Arthrobacter TaxID=235627 RepID=UPI000CFB19D6|nr:MULTISPECIES: extracellular solute-binding protein [unclassified Arthrobacter]PRB43460.1 ABC transporter substrate-binding protein [Arthrobacter sp. MYb51]PRB93704.1 ABC transporter substrate-binding protein [Arthrobacter sp. MYb23]